LCIRRITRHRPGLDLVAGERRGTLERPHRLWEYKNPCLVCQKKTSTPFYIRDVFEDLNAQKSPRESLHSQYMFDIGKH
jgi:hypothetical protein